MEILVERRQTPVRAATHHVSSMAPTVYRTAFKSNSIVLDTCQALP